MTEDKEIRKAVADVKRGFSESGIKANAYGVGTLLSLAERYLQIGEMLPEKMECGWLHSTDTEREKCTWCKETNIYNQAIDDCRLAYTKQLTERKTRLNTDRLETMLREQGWIKDEELFVGLDELESVLIKSEEEYADSFEKGTLLAPTRVHYLATAIRNYIANVSKKVGGGKK